MHEQGFKTSATGLVHGMPPAPCVVVILVVAGDLARTTLVPSLYALASQRLLPDPFAIIGMSRRAWGDETFRDAMRDIVKNRIAFREDVWEKFGRGLYYNPGDLRSAEGYAALREKMSGLDLSAPKVHAGRAPKAGATAITYGDMKQRMASIIRGGT